MGVSIGGGSISWMSLESEPHYFGVYMSEGPRILETPI